MQLHLTIYSKQAKAFSTRNSQTQMINSSDSCASIHLNMASIINASKGDLQLTVKSIFVFAWVLLRYAIG